MVICVPEGNIVTSAKEVPCNGFPGVQYMQMVTQQNPVPCNKQLIVAQKEIYDRDIKPWVDLGMLILGIVIIPGLSFLWIRRLINRQIINDKNKSFPDILLSPPDDMPPALVGLLLNIPGLGRTVLATIFYLANRGILRIEQKIVSGAGAKITYIKLKDTEKYVFEKYIADVYCINSGKAFRIGWKYILVKEKFRIMVEQEAMDQNLFTVRPSKTQGRCVLMVVFGLWLTPVIGLCFWAANVEYTTLGWIPILALIIIGGLIIFKFDRYFLKLTDKGYKEAALWKAFFNHLDQVLKNGNIDTNDINHWNEYLPYAIKLRKHKKWLKLFLANDLPVPEWYNPVLISLKSNDLDTTTLSSKASSKYFSKMIMHAYWEFTDTQDN